MTHPRWLLPAFLLLALMAAGLPFSIETWQQAQNRPNIVFIYTDDLDWPLMAYMPLTRKLIAEQGAVFTNFFVTSSMCCPSRASCCAGSIPRTPEFWRTRPASRNSTGRAASRRLWQSGWNAPVTATPCWANISTCTHWERFPNTSPPAGTIGAPSWMKANPTTSPTP